MKGSLNGALSEIQAYRDRIKAKLINTKAKN